ncbi:hypothetical protein L228DRAFT_179944 [Xylona heveae TC161]|uniref:Uncharacterized protein n=1 Tax=Xylona heveae (strain CBS 132557 / TC161) TaxID=1328760 RepID=A0A165FC65_XYLHT|nr:hypothetical protein L228DRAFT_179944 [Xylona heveae TC161]KZF20811.1 hypothetical protein L228DRAFT_179944 [Xylona heveae TC161]
MHHVVRRNPSNAVVPRIFAFPILFYPFHPYRVATFVMTNLSMHHSNVVKKIIEKRKKHWNKGESKISERKIGNFFANNANKVSS